MKVKVTTEKHEGDKSGQGSVSVIVQRFQNDRDLWTNEHSKQVSQGDDVEVDLKAGMRITITSMEPDMKGDPIKQPVTPGQQPGEVDPALRNAQLEANEKANAEVGGGRPGTPNPNAAQQHEIHNANAGNTIPQAGTGDNRAPPSPTQPSTANPAAPTPQNPAATKPATGTPTPGAPAASGTRASDDKTTPTNRR